jgi:NADH:ubiquinone oxidoreductase subunit H
MLKLAIHKVFLFISVRDTVPRFRYDTRNFMYLAWRRCLALSLDCLLFLLVLGVFTRLNG